MLSGSHGMGGTGSLKATKRRSCLQAPRPPMPLALGRSTSRCRIDRFRGAVLGRVASFAAVHHAANVSAETSLARGERTVEEGGVAESAARQQGIAWDHAAALPTELGIEPLGVAARR